MEFSSLQDTSDYVFAVLYNRVFKDTGQTLTATLRANIYKRLDQAWNKGVSSYRIIACAKCCKDLNDFYKALDVLISPQHFSGDGRDD